MLNLQAMNIMPENSFSTPTVVAASIIAMSIPYLALQFRKPKQLANGKYNTTTGLPKSTGAVPILGDAWELGREYSGKPVEWFNKECRAHNYKPWQFTVPGRGTIIVISSPEHFKQIYSNNEVFLRSLDENSLEFVRDLFGWGLFIAEGDYWLFQRKQASHLFTLANIKDTMATVIQDKLIQVRGLLEKRIEANNAVISFVDIIHRYTADVFGHMGFGVDMKQVDSFGEKNVKNDAIHAISECADWARVRDTSLTFVWKLRRWLNIGMERKYRENLDIIDNLVKDIVEENLAKREAIAAARERGEVVEEEKKSDLISLFLNKSEHRPPSINGAIVDQVTYIRDMIVSFTVAGHETTAQTISWIIIMLNRYPEIEKKILEELVDRIPSELWQKDSEGKYCGLKELPTMDHLSQLPYLEAVIHETLRIEPISAVTRRGATQDIILDDGLLVKKGWSCYIAHSAMARNPAAWGQDAELFKPERWLTKDSPPKFKKLSPYDAPMFGAGRRICLGQLFALWQMKSTLAFLLSRFHFKTKENPWEIGYAIALVRKVKGSLNVRVSLR